MTPAGEALIKHWSHKGNSPRKTWAIFSASFEAGDPYKQLAPTIQKDNDGRQTSKHSKHREVKGPSTFHGHSSNTPQLQLTELNESSQSAKWRIAEGIWRSGSTTSRPYPTKHNVTQYTNVNYFLLRITWQSTTSSSNTCDSTFTCFAMHLWHIGKQTIMNTLPWHVVSYVGHMRTPNTTRTFKTEMQN